jgi:tetratricopeptide (TPR) repeat protein
MVRKKALQEGTMRKPLIMILIITTMIMGMQIMGYAADELFDTKAAAEHMAKGIAHLKAKQYDAAIRELEESASVYPEAEAFYYLGYAYYMKGRKGDGENRKNAMENFNRAYELDPNFTPAKLRPSEPLPLKRQQKNTDVQTSSSETSAQQTPESGTPQQPSPPLKTTDKVRNIGNIPVTSY